MNSGDQHEFDAKDLRGMGALHHSEMRNSPDGAIRE